MTRYRDAVERAGLTPLQRKYLEEYLRNPRIRTIARANRVSPATVRAHVDAALEKIRRAMEEAA